MVSDQGFGRGISIISSLLCCFGQTSLEAEAVVARFQDVARMGQDVGQSGGHLASPKVPRRRVSRNAAKPAAIGKSPFATFVSFKDVRVKLSTIPVSRVQIVLPRGKE